MWTMATSRSARRAQLDLQRAALPDEPGVYVYYDDAGQVLYIGKAKSLRKRVNSYFTKSHDAKTHALVMRIARIEVTVVGSEQEALIFERSLIQRHQPPFNIELRDDKSYPHIAVTIGEEFPRVMFTRERHRKGVRYFGPYASARRTREALELLNRIFPYRPCEGRAPGRQSGTPCLDYHIDRCAAPCIGAISREGYREVIERVMEVLEGRPERARNELEQQMREASDALEFERAARIRNRIAELDTVIELQAVERPGAGSFDVLGVALGEGQSAVHVLQVRDGQLFDRRARFLERTEGASVGTVLTQYALAAYGPGIQPIPPLIVVEHGALMDDDHALLGSELAAVRGLPVEVRGAQRGEKRRLVELATRNAQHAMSYDSVRAQQRRDRQERAMERLRDELGLDSLPLRIECYDISNLQDQAPVASMVVFEEGHPKKSDYRHFSIRYEGGQDDFAMMGEVIERRFRRHGDGESGVERDESFDAAPDLVVIDGGKGQLGAAVAALRRLGIERVSVCSLAKRDEEIFLPGQRSPVVLSKRDPALQLLQRIRDEAHRFALGHHRTRRGHDMRHSILDQLEGVGPTRKRALLNFFGSPERVLEASLEELEAVPGLPGKVARSMYDQLHRLAGRSV